MTGMAPTVKLHLVQMKTLALCLLLRVLPADAEQKSTVTAEGRAVVASLLLNAEAKREAGDFRASVELSSRAIAAEPANPRAYLQRAEALLRLGAADATIADATKAIELKYGRPAPYRIRSAAYIQKGRYQEAVADLKTAAELNPDLQSKYEAALKKYSPPSPPQSSTAPALPPPRTVPGPAAAASRLGWTTFAGAAAAALVAFLLAVLAARRVKKAKIVRFGTVMEPFKEEREPKVGGVVGGRVILGPLLERGDRASLYEGRDLSDRGLIVKRVRFAPGEAGSRDRLVAQAKALAALAHPALCAPVGVYEHEGDLYLAYEAVPGESLGRRLAQAPGRRLAPGECLKVVGPVCSALGAAHAAGVVLGCLRPSSIVLEQGTARICDLGSLSASEAAAYAAPEQEADRPGPAGHLSAVAGGRPQG